MSSSSPASINRAVMDTSSELGVASPDGWLWTMAIAGHVRLNAAVKPLPGGPGPS